jgi:uncharacterized membrane protein
MRRVVLLGLLILLLVGLTAVSPTQAQEQPTVRAVMFWMEGCGHCDVVKEQVLPPLAARYGDQWRLELVELSGMEDFDKLFAMGANLGIPRTNIGVPFLMIGDAVLIGGQQIPAELPGLVEHHLAQGGVGLPAAPGLEAFLPELAGATAVLPTTLPATPASTAPANDGFLLATLILIGMVLAIGYTALRVYRARQGQGPKQAATWADKLFPVLLVIGLGVAGYLAYVETQAVAPICGPVGDCAAVQTSEYAYLFGIPIGVLGVIGYLAILAAWGWGKWQGDPRAPLALLGLTAFGVLFSIYLTYLEPFVIGAVCAWCLTSAVVMTLLLLASLETAVPHLQPARKRR